MRKTFVAVAWLFFIACPSAIGVLVLEAISHKPVVYHAGEYVCQVERSPDDKTLASTDLNGTVTLFDAASRRPRATLHGHTQYVRQLAFSPDGGTIVTASNDDTLKVWDAATGREKCTLRGHQGSVSCVAFTPDGQSIVSAGEDTTIRLWDVRSGENTATFHGHTDAVRPLALSPDGRFLASHDRKTLKLWDVAARKERATLSESLWHALAFSPDGRTLAAVGDGPKGCLGLWDVEAGTQHLFDDPFKTANGLFDGSTHHLQFSPDGKRLVSCRRVTKYNEYDSADYVSMARVDIWDVATGEKTHTLGRGANQLFPPTVSLRYWLRESSGPDVSSVLFAPDGRLVTLERDGSEIRMREIDFGMSWYCRVASILVAVLTLAIACCAMRYWFTAGFIWQLRCLLSLATLTALMFLNWYLSVFWVEAWGENTMPTDLFLFTHKFWVRFLAVLVSVLFLTWAAGRKSPAGSPRTQGSPVLMSVALDSTSLEPQTGPAKSTVG